MKRVLGGWVMSNNSYFQTSDEENYHSQRFLCIIMITTTFACRTCQSRNVKLYGRNCSGTQRYHCNDCGTTRVLKQKKHSCQKQNKQRSVPIQNWELRKFCTDSFNTGFLQNTFKAGMQILSSRTNRSSLDGSGTFAISMPRIRVSEAKKTRATKKRSKERIMFMLHV